MKYARFLAARTGQVFLGLLLALLTGCDRPEEVKPPPQLLSKQEMASLLVQLHLLEARVESSRLTPDSARALFQQQKREILRKNNISEKDSVLPRSYRFYAINNKDMDEIYKIVIDSLEHRANKLNGSTTPSPQHP
ncbi:DUF4296 domain-containing protein [Hymenobacter setariae]|uniref:DUF4296 domain-containing protein n=1 Tax=Hymenobacter setariae TaxID=2594794 RepID=A0A558BRH6_9BACT|nr:DUF4296 domain-containing protein [Hymenobacter setariae]TVT39119.1 DUF4296 domain-containing protein [Hymenobacter setariae]